VEEDWETLHSKFLEFTKKFHKDFDEISEKIKFNNFVHNLKIAENNKKKNHFTFDTGVNVFSDLSWKEFDNQFLMHDVNIQKEIENFKTNFPDKFKSVFDIEEKTEKDINKIGSEKKIHLRNLQRNFWSNSNDSDDYDSSSESNSNNYSNNFNQYRSNYYSNPNHYSNHYNPSRYSSYNHHNLSRYSYKSPGNNSSDNSNQKRLKIDPILNNYPLSKTWQYESSPVKNQKKCAACYAFAALAAVELFAQRNGFYINLSEQEIIDCNTENNGCIGGSPFKVFDYITNHGISLSSEYPYEAILSSCQVKKANKRFQASIHYYFITNPVELIIALNKGPAVMLHHVNQNFKSYTGGIFNDENCSGLINHASLAVGYDLTGPIPYILCKNGWGPGWGENGYYKIALGEVTRNGKGFCNMFSHEANVVPIVY
jgi:hypothetical protein